MGKPKGEPRAAWADAEAADEKRARARAIVRRLERAYPEATTALHHRNPFELLIATVLSAQSTDRKINEITPALFAKYPSPEAFLASKPGELEADIKQSGFFNQKAKAIRGICAALVERYGGEVPGDMDELVTLPGVARKTASVVLWNAFGKNQGVAVDTHVHRLAWRLAFSDHGDANKVERDLMALFPRAKWGTVTHVLIDHGRAVCSARAPRCEECVANARCPARRDAASSG